MPAGKVSNFWETQLARVHLDDREGLQAAVERGLQSGRSINLDYRVERPDGSVGHVAARARVVTDDAG